MPARTLWILTLLTGLTGCGTTSASVSLGGATPAPPAVTRARHLSPEVVALSNPASPVAFEGFELDLGVGEAPYDDGPSSPTPERWSRAGFSDALLRATWTHRVAPGTTLLTGISARRVQDEPIQASLRDLDVAWAVIGIRISF